jgi:hypothetical protein
MFSISPSTGIFPHNTKVFSFYLSGNMNPRTRTVVLRPMATGIIAHIRSEGAGRRAGRPQAGGGFRGAAERFG